MELKAMASREVGEASTSIVGFYDDEDNLGGSRDGLEGEREGEGRKGGLLHLGRYPTYYMYPYIEQKQYLVLTSQGFYESCPSNQII